MITLSKDNYRLRGYPEGSFRGQTLHKVQIKFHIPLAKPQYGIMTPPFGLSRIKLIPFFESGRAGSFEHINQLDWHSSLGSELVFNANFGYGRWPIDIHTSIAKGLDKYGEWQSQVNIKTAF